ncbi:CDP-alcohol phosphatidyltransferase family protein [Nitratireductor kimnyeongensis]|uniref:CDP-alcohol phosphatidyltransferase family protein n=1 Tax=Nitratireductor kimnyeongensis TaxID=430679 RepID=A0ABW0T7Z0_9HYPH|nr:CDP-alcohol phosphatidyltransferase family protein [Nitratireductor kimnyeongensis]QZZ34329.1 CDP-alcohol phosphatidyltransferase family protein [Nitratireductor kimnyeongensis]
MLDGWAHRKINPGLSAVATQLAGAGVRANAVTYAGLALGLAAAAAIAYQGFWAGLALILASRLCDGLDGAIARIHGKTDFGGYLDIVLDFAFYGAVPLGFIIADPGANAIAGAVLLLAFYVNGASFLAYAVMAEKRRLKSDARGEKSLFFTTGLAEASETLAVFVAMCLLPSWFPVLAYGFAALTAYTTVSRMVLASRRFG